jgi:hypothetical protein
MSPLALELARRMSWFALACAIVLLAVPRVASELGLWGQSVEDEIAAAERALHTAKEYGAGEETAPFAAARAGIEHARERVRQGEEWRARRAARAAAQQAIEAQRAALTGHETARRQSATVAIEIDRRLNELEALHAELSVGVDKPTSSAMMSIMKEARRKGAGVLLSIEEGDYRRATEQQEAALATLEAAKQRLRDARGGDSGGVGG